MTISFLYAVLLAISFVVAVNSFILFQVARRFQLQNPAMLEQKLLAAETPLPEFKGKMVVNDKPIHRDDFIGKPGVIVFIGARCTMCQQKMPEFFEVAEKSSAIGVDFWVVGLDSLKRILPIVSNTPLHRFTVNLLKSSKKTLNPSRSSPIYIFYDHEGIVKTSNIVGDENWQGFLAQLRNEESEDNHSKEPLRASA